jgi:hypothetical protein
LNTNKDTKLKKVRKIVPGLSFHLCRLGGQNKSRSISGSQQEEYSTVGTECYVNQGFTNDLSEYGRNFAQTPVSLASTPDQVKSTSLEDKKQNFR